MAEGAALEKRFSRKETWVRIPPSPPDYAKASSGRPVIEVLNGMRTFPDVRRGLGSATEGRRRERSDRAHPTLSARKFLRNFTCN